MTPEHQQAEREGEGAGESYRRGEVMRVLTESDLQTIFDSTGLHYAKYGIRLAAAVEEAVLRKISAKPLSEAQIIDATEHIDTSRDGYFIHIARAIEHAHGIGIAASQDSAKGGK